MGRRHKDGIRGDSVHVDAGPGLDVIHVYVAVFGDQVDDVVLGGHLHGYREVVLGFSGEEHVHRFLGEGLVAPRSLANL